MSRLEQKYVFKTGLETKNRLVLAPLTISSSLPGGYVSSADIAFYRRRAGSAGILVTGSAYVRADGQAFRGSFSAAEDDKIPGLRNLARAMKSKGNLAILQLYHGGRMVPPDLVVGDRPLAPSAVIAEHGQVLEPKAASRKEVEELLEAFLAAISRAIQAGFDGVELHGANTYLIQQFLSPHSNRRTDQWGGTEHNRRRFAKTLVKKAKALIAEQADRPFLLGYRLSPEEIEEPGLSLFDSLQLLEQLIPLGLDYVHLSLAQAQQSSLRNPTATESVLKQIAQKLAGRLPIVAVGGIGQSSQVEEILQLADFAAMGRQLLVDPDWLTKVMTDQEALVSKGCQVEDWEELALPLAFATALGSYLEG